MCWFAALGIAMSTWSMAATAASTAMSVYSAVSGAKGEQGQAKYNAAVARNNALSAEYQAQDAISRGNKAPPRSPTSGIAGAEQEPLVRRISPEGGRQRTMGKNANRV